MRYYYAQIDENNLCVGILDTHAPINLPSMVPLSSMQHDVLGKTLVDGEWVNNTEIPT